MAEQVTQVLGIVGIKNMGEYNSSTYYEKLNVVTYNGSSYCAKQSSRGILPTNTDYWQLYAEKGDTGDKGDKGDTPVKGVDYYTPSDKQEFIDELETTLDSDVTDEVTEQLGGLVSATPLVASSISGMTDTSRIYVNSTDGHWYWYDGSSWRDGGVYQAAEDSDTLVNLETGYNFLFNDKVIPVYKEISYNMNATASSGNVTYGDPIIEQDISDDFRSIFIKYNLEYVGTDWAQIGVRINTLNSNNEIIRRIFIPGANGSLNSTFTENEVKFKVYVAGQKNAGQAYTELFKIKCMVYSNDTKLAPELKLPRYEDIGDKIKENFASLDNNFIEHTRSKNYLAANGSYANQTAAKECTTAFIDIEDYSSVYITLFGQKDYTLGKFWAVVGCFNENKNWISRLNVNLSKTEFPLNKNYIIYQGKISSFPANTKYIKISYRTYDDTIKMRINFNEPYGYIDYFPSLNDINYKIEQVPNFRVNYNFNNKFIKGINHRGYNTVAPENTISAYKLSKQNGFDFVECDVALTSDKVPVLLHDDTIDRTSNGSGNINNLTFEQVRQYDFGSWKSPDYAGEKIPSFEEFIIFCRNAKLYPYIELKPSTAYTQEDIDNLVDIVHKYKMELNCTWISFTLDYLVMVTKADKTARVLWLGPSNLEDYYINLIKRLDTKQNEFGFNISLDKYNAITQTQFNSLKASKIPLEVWVVNNQSTILSLDPYVSGVTSDSLKAAEIIYNDAINN